MNSFLLSFVVLILCLPAIYTQTCGDGVCTNGVETPSNCPDDCGLCGNNVCDYNQFEDRHYCPTDCSLYLETFVFGNDYVTWVPSSAVGTVSTWSDGSNYLSVSFPARAANSFAGYFDIYNSDWAQIVSQFYRHGFFYYELQIVNQNAVADATFPDFVIYSQSTNSFLYYYFSVADYNTLNDHLWHDVSIDLEANQWYYAVANSQGFVDFTAGTVSTDAIWDSFNGTVSGIYIKGQFSNAGGVGNLGAFQLANQGVTGICTPNDCNAVTHNCGSNGCGVECGTCSSGQTCSNGVCATISGPVSTGTTSVPVPVSTGTTGTTAIFSTGTTAVPVPVSTGTTGTTGVFTTGSSGTTGVFSTGSTGTTGIFTTGSTGTTAVPVPVSTGTTAVPVPVSTGTTGIFSTGSTGTTGIFSTGSTGTTAVPVPVSTGTTGIFTTGSTGTTGIFSTGTTGIHSTGTTGTTGVHTTGTTGVHTTGTTGSTCGNGVCNGPAETVFNCPEDCGTCGDHYCDPNTENAMLCPEDCGYCGNKMCEASRGENQITCEVDCGSSVCGDSICTAGESAQTCPSDCASPQPNTVAITLNFAGLIPAQDCCSCCGKK